MQLPSLFPLHQCHLVLDLGDVGVDSLGCCLKCLQVAPYISPAICQLADTAECSDIRGRGVGGLLFFSLWDKLRSLEQRFANLQPQIASTYIDIFRQHLIRDLIFLQYVVIYRSTCQRRTKQKAEESRIEQFVRTMLRQSGYKERPSGVVSIGRL